jgi:putative ATPase
MRQEGYSAGYEYDHNAEGGVSGQNYFPDGVTREDFYQPTDRGLEQEISKRLAEWRKLRDAREQQT